MWAGAAFSLAELFSGKQKPPSVGVQFPSRCVADTSSPLGSAIFTIISAVAQLERDIIAGRVKAGLRRAKENGVQIGRPRVLFHVEEAQKLRLKGLSLREIGKKIGVSRTTVLNYLKNDLD